MKSCDLLKSIDWNHLTLFQIAFHLKNPSTVKPLDSEFQKIKSTSMLLHHRLLLNLQNILEMIVRRDNNMLPKKGKLQIREVTWCSHLNNQQFE